MGAVLSAFVASSAGQWVLADSIEPVTLETENGTPAICNSDDISVYVPQPSSTSESPCPAHARETGETARARAYLIATATPGYTMTRQGPERAIGRLHPQFVNRLAAAIAEARGAGLLFAGVFSAYRPPAFGVGGFVDKFHSLHTYGLAVDVTGIGAPGTPEAQHGPASPATHLLLGSRVDHCAGGVGGTPLFAHELLPARLRCAGRNSPDVRTRGPARQTFRGLVQGIEAP